MIDFPNSPTVGQIFNSGSGPIYIWDGVAWSLATAQTKTARRLNKLTNPAMQVSQENSTTAVSANGGYPVDQWTLQTNGAPAGSSAMTIGAGVPNCLRLWSGTGGPASPAAGNYAMVIQPLEGDKVSDLYWGTPNAIPAVLRFKARATNAPSIPFTFGVSVRAANGTRSYVQNFTITAASVFQEFVMPIPGDTVGTWPVDNTVGASVGFTGMTGATFVAPAAGWNAGNLLAAPGMGNLFAAANQGLDIADVGLYADPDNTGLPPPFETPDYGEELIRCQRYWHRFSGYMLFTPYAQAGGQVIGPLFFQSMRIAPSVAYSNVSYANASALTTNGISDRFIMPQISAAAAGQAYAGFTASLNARM